MHAGKGWENYRSVFQRMSGRPCNAVLPPAAWSDIGDGRDAEPLLAPPQSARRRRSPRLAASQDRAPAAAPGACDPAACEGEAADAADDRLHEVPAASPADCVDAPVAYAAAPLYRSPAVHCEVGVEQQMEQALEEGAGRIAADGALTKGVSSAAADVSACQGRGVEQEASSAAESAGEGDAPAAPCEEGNAPQPPELVAPEIYGTAQGGGDALGSHPGSSEADEQQGASAAGPEDQSPEQAPVPRRQRGKRRSTLAARPAPISPEVGGTGRLLALATP